MRLITSLLSHGKYKSNLCEDGIQEHPISAFFLSRFWWSKLLPMHSVQANRRWVSTRRSTIMQPSSIPEQGRPLYFNNLYHNRPPRIGLTRLAQLRTGMDYFANQLSFSGTLSQSVPLLVVAAEDEVANQGWIKDLSLFMLFLFLLLCIASSLRKCGKQVHFECDR